jgi:transketolase
MSVASISPAPLADLRAALARFPLAVTVEAHYATGGLGSLVCETAAEAGADCRVARCGVTRSPAGEQGGQEFLNRLHGIGPEQIATAVLKAFRETRARKGVRATAPTGDWGAIRDTRPARKPAKPA